MLVLSRREGERIRIGEGITITVVRISPQAVRIGIEAPSNLLVVRQELLDRTEDGPHIPEEDVRAETKSRDDPHSRRMR